MYPVMVIIC